MVLAAWELVMPFTFSGESPALIARTAKTIQVESPFRTPLRVPAIADSRTIASLDPLAVASTPPAFGKTSSFRTSGSPWARPPRQHPSDLPSPKTASSPGEKPLEGVADDEEEGAGEGDGEAGALLATLARGAEQKLGFFGLDGVLRDYSVHREGEPADLGSLPEQFKAIAAQHPEAMNLIHFLAGRASKAPVANPDAHIKQVEVESAEAESRKNATLYVRYWCLWSTRSWYRSA